METRKEFACVRVSNRAGDSERATESDDVLLTVRVNADVIGAHKTVGANIKYHILVGSVLPDDKSLRIALAVKFDLGKVPYARDTFSTIVSVVPG